MSAYELIERADRDQLGEAPFWHEGERALFWVDIVGKSVHRFDPATGERRRWSVPKHCSAAIPTTGGDLIVALTDGLHRLDRDSGETRPFARPDPNANNRSNECRTDMRGRIWLGTMCNNLAPDGSPIPLGEDSGGVFCVEADGRSHRMLSHIGISNILCWSPDGSRFYSADTRRQTIWSFAYDPEEPTLTDRRVLVEGGPGGPDGSSMDEAGCLWTARWGGGRVIRYAPDGRVDREIMLPVAQPSNCAFGGDDRRTLYITSARQELEGLAPDSLDGSVFAVRVDTPGMPMTLFAG